MKFVACTDLHADMKSFKSVLSLVEKSKADMVVCCGDFTICERNIEFFLSTFEKFPVPVFLVHGNHESEENVKHLCSGLKNVTFLHKKIIELNSACFAGWGGGGFSRRDKKFESWWQSKEKSLKSPLVLVTHAPPFGTGIDFVHGGHVGCESFTDFIIKKSPAIVLSGHIEENSCIEGMTGKTRVINPGPRGIVVEV